MAIIGTGPKAPLSDAIIMAVSRLVDDAGASREPSHYQIETQIQRADLVAADPHKQGTQVGKAKRVRAVLGWALDNGPSKGELFVAYLVAMVRGCGGESVGSNLRFFTIRNLLITQLLVIAEKATRGIS